MTTFLLIRHASTEAVGKTIAGRMPGIPLSMQGEMEAQRLVARLANAPIRAIYCSPLERARKTAEPLARHFGLDVIESEGLVEMDFGAWTGREIVALEHEERWRRFNAFRSGTRVPGGELMVQVQARVVATLEELSREHPEGWVAVVSHSDVIKAAIMHYAGIPLDLVLRLEISPASVSIVTVDNCEARLKLLNHIGEIE